MNLSINLLLIAAIGLFIISSNITLLNTDYLSLIFILPYMNFYMDRLNGEKPNTITTLILGSILAFGIYLKPLYIVLFAFFEFILMKRLYQRLFSFILISLMVGFGLFLNFSTYMYVDVAWVLESAQRILEGGVFGKDITNSNPPLIWYLATPIVFLSKLSQWHIETIFWPTLAAINIAILVWTSSLIKRSSILPSSLHITFLLSSFYVFFLLDGKSAGQREALALLFSLPYLSIAAAQLNGFKCSHTERIFAGLIGGIGIALKPYFLVVPFLVELFLWFKTKKFSHLRRSEFLTGSTTLFLYWILVLILAPAYIFEVAPLVYQSIDAWKLPYSDLLILGGASAISFFILAILCKKLKAPDFVYILTLAGCGFVVSYVVQAKHFNYHQFPLFAVAIIVFSLVIAENIHNHKSQLWAQKRHFIHIGLGLLMILLATNLEHAKIWYQFANKQGHSSWSLEQKQFIDLLGPYSSKDKFLAISVNFYPGFPTAIYVPPRWAGIDAHRLHMPAINKLRAEKKHNSTLFQLEKAERNQIMQEIKQKPIIVLVQSTPNYAGSIKLSRFMNLLDFYLEDPAFQVEWANYKEIQKIGKFRVFKRKKL